MSTLTKVVISGGGTGGHIHPALAIADEIKRRNPQAEVHFVGALGKMEMDKVPAAGYSIDGLWISGLNRRWTSTQNLSFPFKLLHSLWAARRILRAQQPQVVVGVGGFASGPLLDQAVRKGIPTLIQEQNSFPGITNRLLARRVDRICAGLPGLDRWFPKDRIVQTGNPLRAHVRELMNEASPDLGAARSHWGLPNEGPMVFIMGGSLGAQSMNEAVQNILSRKPRLSERGYQILWQCGARYLDACQAWLNAHPCDGVICKGFIDRMDLAYQAADLIASRAGAMSIAELALVGKPSILVPSPHVAEDHQTHNARSLTELGGALLLRDDQVQTQLGHHLQSLIADRPKCEAMGTAMRQAARPQAASDVVDELEKLVA